MNKPISTRSPAVVVEYACRGKRKQRRFENPFEARRFWIEKDRAGRNPRVKRETERCARNAAFVEAPRCGSAKELDPPAAVPRTCETK